MIKLFRRLLLIFTLLGISLLTDALYEPHTLEIKYYNISNKELSGIKIAFAADFHLAPNDTARLQKIISALNQQQPDIIILGGDYVKGHKRSSAMPARQIASMLTRLHAPYGIYAVLGNHDVWYGKTTITDALQKQNITVLDNENRHINIKNKELSIIGISDKATDKPDFVKAFQNATAPAVLITHSPDTFPESPKTALTLAAHTHGGQIRLPLLGAPVVNSAYGQRYNLGLISENDKMMIVTKGLGTSILPLRFNCRPEIVIISFND